MAGLREIAHPEIGQQHADIKGHGAIEGELGIDDAGLLRRHHHRAGVEIAMQKGFRRGGENVFQALGRHFQIAVGAQLLHDAIELRRGMAVELRVIIGIAEDQAFGDVAQRHVVGKEREISLAQLGIEAEVGTAKQGARQKQSEVLGNFRQFLSGDQGAAQNDMGREEFHDDDRLARIEMENLRHHSGIALSLSRQGMILEEGALQRQGPAIAHEADIGQRLLDDHGALGAFDDEDQIEIAVADFAHFPGLRISADPVLQRGKAAQPCGQRFGAQGDKIFV